MPDSTPKGCQNCVGELGWYICTYCGFTEKDHPIFRVEGFDFKDCAGPSEEERNWRPCGLCVPDELQAWIEGWRKHHA